MAQLKDSLVEGDLRVTDSVYTTTAQLSILKAPQDGTGNFTSGTNGQYLRTNSNEAFWSSLAPSITTTRSSNVPTTTLSVGAEETSFQQAIIDLVYPVGAIYISTSNVSPTTLFGGTWQQIQDTFLLAAGTTYSAGNTGGSATHTLTIAELAAHTHSITTHNHTIATHSHSLNGHTHSIATHAHSLNGHTHSVATHSHTIATHVHSLNGHTHSVATHAHSLNGHTHSVTTHNHTFSSGVAASAGSHQHHGYYRTTVPNGNAQNILIGSGGQNMVGQTTDYVTVGAGAHTHSVTGTVGNGGPNKTGGPSTTNTGNGGPDKTGGPSTTNTGSGGGGTTGNGGPDKTGGPSTTNTGNGGPDKTGGPSTTNTGDGGPTVTGNGGTTVTDSTGSATAFSIMPPYLVVYMWKRTA